MKTYILDFPDTNESMDVIADSYEAAEAIAEELGATVAGELVERWDVAISGGLH